MSQPAELQERLETLVSIVEGQSPPDVRLKIARELLLQGRSEVAARLAVTLERGSEPARVAVATALAELPQALQPVYIDPLVKMLGAAEPAVREAGARALAAYRDGGVIQRVTELLADAETPRPLRQAAIVALGLMPQREAVASLAGVLDDADPVIARAALDALEQATALSFRGDVESARTWWEASRALPLEEWQQRQIDRLVRENRQMARALETVEQRLVRALETNFERASDAERIAVLATFLQDESPAVRRLGLRLTQVLLAEGKVLSQDLPAEFRARVRELLDSPLPDLKAAAVRTVASFHDAEDAGRFVEMLTAASSPAVLYALINGLGYVGTGAAVEPLLGMLALNDETATAEAVAALGRLAERDVLSTADRQRVSGALLEVFQQSTPAQVALRERLLWAMEILRDPRFGTAFAEALKREEGVVVRLAAARGIAALANPKLADALVPAVSDPDPAVRRTAIEPLARLGSTDEHLAALWERLNSAVETDEGIRQTAARAALEMLARRPAADVERWIARLPGSGPDRASRMLALLELLLTKAQEADPTARDRLGVIRVRIARVQAELNQYPQVVATYRQALADLEAAGAPVESVAVELLQTALRADLYDEAIAAELSAANPGLAADVLLAGVQSELDALIARDLPEQARAMLRRFQENPPGMISAEQLAALRDRLDSLSPAATSQPATTQPIPEEGGPVADRR